MFWQGTKHELNQLIDRLIDAVMAVSMALTVILGFVAVFFRYVIGSSLAWSFEVMLVLMTYITFIGCYAALRHNKHLRVDILVNALPRTLKIMAIVSAHFLVLLVTMSMLKWGLELYQSTGSRTLTMTGIPQKWVYIIIPISGAAMTINTIVHLSCDLRKFLKGALL